MDPQLVQSINIQIGNGFRDLSNALRQLDRTFQQYGQSANNATKGTTNTNRAMNQTSKSARKASNSVGGLGGRVSNIQAGLVQLSNYLLILNQRINNTFANMTKKFTKAEDSMTRLKISIGLAGKTALDMPDQFRKFGETESLIRELAATTQFTKTEIADAFRTLVTSGRTLEEANKIIRSNLQFATASGGLLDLKESTETARLALGTLGVGVQAIPRVMNMLTRVSQKTAIGFDEVNDVMRGAKSAFAAIGGEPEEKAASIMIMAAALKTIGDTGRGAGQHLSQFTSTINGVISSVKKYELRASAGIGGRGRLDQKRQYLLELFGVDRMSMAQLEGQVGQFVMKGDHYQKRLQDAYVKSMFLTPGGKKRDTIDIFQRLTSAYGRLQLERGQGEAQQILEKAFGQKAGLLMLEGVIKLADQAGLSIDQAGDHFKNLVKNVMQDEKDLLRAEDASRKTLSYRTKLLESAYDDLSNTIFKHDLVAKDAVDTHKEMISATATLMKNNDGLATTVGMLGRSLQVLTGVGANLGFALVAAATFSYGLNYALGTTTVAAAGLSGTLSAFATTFLVPTLTIVLQFTGALAVLSLGIVALVRYLGDGKSVAESFTSVLNTLKNAAKATGGMMNLLFSKEFGDKGVFANVKRFFELRRLMVEQRKKDDIARTETLAAIARDKAKVNTAKNQRDYYIALHNMTIHRPAKLKRIGKEYNQLEREMSKLKGVMGKSGYEGLYEFIGNERVVLNIASIVDGVRELGAGLMVIAEGAIEPVMLGIAGGLKLAKIAIIALLAPFKILARVFGLASDEASALQVVLKSIGFILGSFIGLIIFRKSILLVQGALATLKVMAIATKNGVIQLGQSALGASVGMNTATNSASAFANALNRVSAGLVRVGGPFMLFGTLLSYIGYEDAGGVIMGIGMAMLFLGNILPFVGNRVALLQGKLLPVLLTLSLIALAVYALVNAFSDAEMKMPSLVGGTIASNNSTAYQGDLGTEQMIAGLSSSPNSPASPITPGTYSMAGNTPTYTSAPSTRTTTQNVTHDNRVTYNVNRQIVQTKGDPVQFARRTAKLSGKTAGSDYAMAHG